MKNITAVVLAAGLGTRMKTETPKVLHEIFSRPMIDYVVTALEEAGINSIVAVVGYGGKKVEEYFKDRKNIVFVDQKKLLGTADALKKALVKVPSAASDVLVLCGDAPLIRTETLKRLIKQHKSEKAYCSIVTTSFDNPKGYGRIIRDQENRIVKIIEELDASKQERAVKEINSGIYCFDKKLTKQALKCVKPENKKGEYYLTDIVAYLVKKNKKVCGYHISDSSQVIGVNSRKELALCQDILRKRYLEYLMAEGVTIMDPASTFIDPSAKIQKDSVIMPFTIIGSNVVMGKRCVIGPFTHIRAKTKLADDVHVGAFVEVNRTCMGPRSKAKHQSYLGDTIIGQDVNIGAGTITANYDGKAKHQTIIENNSFVGSGTILVAPVKVGKGAMTGAGAVVTKNRNVKNGAVVVGIPARELKKDQRPKTKD